MRAPVPCLGCRHHVRHRYRDPDVKPESECTATNPESGRAYGALGSRARCGGRLYEPALPMWPGDER